MTCQAGKAILQQTEGLLNSVIISMFYVDQPNGHSTGLPASEAAERGGRNPGV